MQPDRIVIAADEFIRVEPLDQGAPPNSVLFAPNKDRFELSLTPPLLRFLSGSQLLLGLFMGFRFLGHEGELS